MFGRSLSSIIKWALIGGVVFLLASLLLTNIVTIVDAYRSGDFTQLVLLCILTGIAVRIEGAYSGGGDMIAFLLKFFAVIMCVFLCGVVFFIPLTAGILFSITGVVITIVVLTAWRDPSSITSNLESKLGSKVLSYITTPESSHVLVKSLEQLGMRVLILPDGAWDNILGILRDRPKLPVAAVHFMEQDVLIVKAKGNLTWMRQTRELLETRGIGRVKEASKLFTRIVLAMPVLLEKGPSKIKLDQYHVVRDKETVAIVLAQKPAQMVVHPSNRGLVVVAKTEDVFGLNTEEIPVKNIPHVLIGRDISVLEDKYDPTGGQNNAN
ncbi:MAG: hypothetical protein ACTSV2_03580 [Candidatus Thorarchaeota archaeon]